MRWGSLLGTEEVVLDSEFQKDTQELEDGLYVVLGNDSRCPGLYVLL